MKGGRGEWFRRESGTELFPPTARAPFPSSAFGEFSPGVALKVKQAREVTMTDLDVRCLP